ncbi:MAG TPA: L,D-transpeptidase [Actinomycetota bacterium]|jgi:lipoprotein-anchoring transpeptidase ErfK/SrfK|nr:L,D-transpeptidase [Actinomycetota bacterium]
MSELKTRAPAAVIALLLALALAGCGGDDPAPAAAPDSATAAPATTGSPAPRAGQVDLGDAPAYVALAVKDVTVRSRPRGGDVVAVFPADLPWGSPTPFLIKEARRTAAGDTWLEVLLPRRPNGASGWIRDDQVKVKPLSHAVEIDLSTRTASLLRDHRKVRTWRVGIGTAGTPTPTGRFYVTVKLRPPQISAAAYGAWALGLSGYSEVHQSFGTGDGQIALHGTYKPWLLGRPVSNGCVRMDNETITMLAETLPLGTPVTIRG